VLKFFYGLKKRTKTTLIGSFFFKFFSNILIFFLFVKLQNFKLSKIVKIYSDIKDKKRHPGFPDPKHFGNAGSGLGSVHNGYGSTTLPASTEYGQKLRNLKYTIKR